MHIIDVSGTTRLYRLSEWADGRHSPLHFEVHIYMRYICIYMHVYVCICMSLYIMCIYACTYVHGQIDAILLSTLRHTSICVCVRVYTYEYILYVYLCVYICGWADGLHSSLQLVVYIYFCMRTCVHV